MNVAEQVSKLASESNLGFGSASALVFGYLSYLRGNRHAKRLVEDELATIAEYLSKESVEDFFDKVDKAKPSAWVLANKLYNQSKNS